MAAHLEMDLLVAVARLEVPPSFLKVGISAVAAAALVKSVRMHPRVVEAAAAAMAVTALHLPSMGHQPITAAAAVVVVVVTVVAATMAAAAAWAAAAMAAHRNQLALLDLQTLAVVVVVATTAAQALSSSVIYISENDLWHISRS